MKRKLLSAILAGGLILPASSAFAAGRGARGFGGAHAAPSMGHAVPRGSYGHGGVGGAVIVPSYGGFYGPRYGWGLSGYDPLWYGWGYGYPYGYAAPVTEATGGLRLEVKPNTAQVFVDGYYAGVVDDFDGHFQHLDLAPGGHRIEVRAPGFQPLTFDTYIQANHTTDYKTTLVPAGESDRQ